MVTQAPAEPVTAAMNKRLRMQHLLERFSKACHTVPVGVNELDSPTARMDIKLALSSLDEDNVPRRNKVLASVFSLFPESELADDQKQLLVHVLLEWDQLAQMGL